MSHRFLVRAFSAVSGELLISPNFRRLTIIQKARKIPVNPEKMGWQHEPMMFLSVPERMSWWSLSTSHWPHSGLRTTAWSLLHQIKLIKSRANMDQISIKTPNPKCRHFLRYLVAGFFYLSEASHLLFGVVILVKQFYRFGIWSNTQCITPVYTLRFTQSPPHPFYLFSQGGGGG